MLVRIIPLTRLPSGIHHFDYVLSPELQTKISIGQIVKIPFRKTTKFGIVLSLQPKPDSQDFQLKQVEELITTQSIISEEQIKLLIFIAKFYGVSAGNIIKNALPPLKKNKFAKIEEFLPQGQDNQTITKPIYLLYKDETERRDNILKIIQNGKTLLILPRVEQVKEMVNLLRNHTKIPISVWHSELSQKEKWDEWFRIMQDDGVIIGTRGSILLPIPDLNSIIIDLEHDDEHKQWDMSPRFHTKDIAEIKRLTLGVSTILMSYTPSIESYHNIYEQNYNIKREIAKNDLLFEKKERAEIIDMVEEFRAGKFNALSSQVKEAIISSEKDIFILVSRRGFSRTLTCNKCGHTELCTMCEANMVYHKTENKLVCHYCNKSREVEKVCVSCHNDMLEFKGYGTEFIVEGVRSLIDDTDSVVTRIDRDTGQVDLDPTKRNIVVGTELALHTIDWSKLDLVVYVDPDKTLQIPENNADERLWHIIQTLFYRSPEDAKIIIQTFSKNHTVFLSTNNPDLFYRSSLLIKRKFSYPPFSIFVRYLCSGSSKQSVKLQAEKMHTNLIQQTEQMKIPCVISQPLETHPQFYRNQYWQVILIRFPTNTRLNTIAIVHNLFDKNWKVDPRPKTIQGF